MLEVEQEVLPTSESSFLKMDSSYDVDSEDSMRSAEVRSFRSIISEIKRVSSQSGFIARMISTSAILSIRLRLRVVMVGSGFSSQARHPSVYHPYQLRLLSTGGIL
jgi:hypothetical protein